MVTINELCEAYLANRANPYASRKCKHPKSLRTHLVVVRKEWGEMKLKDFRKGSKQTVAAKVSEWRAAGTSAHTVRKRISVLRTVFRFAISEELIERSKEPVMELPPNGPPRERFVDVETELPKLLKAADEIKTPQHVRDLVELLLRTGQRRGAVLALKWEHVDFEKRVIRFRDTEAAEDRSKKRRGNKPMDDELYALLERAKEATPDGCEFVINWRGKGIKNAYHSMRALFRRAGLEDLRTHDLRRSSATYVHNETDGDIAKAASHIVDSEATARKHYVQEDPRVHMPAMSAVANVMSRARSSCRGSDIEH